MGGVCEGSILTPVSEVLDTAPPREAFVIREATVSLVEAPGGGPIDEDGNVTIQIIRPSIGKGRGKHYYGPDMLRENAQKFTGWKMYVNHLSPEARRKAGGLPRDVADLGGRIIESWWDPTVPPTDRFEQGAVVGKARPTPFIRELIANDPEIVEASISTNATGVKQGTVKGQKVWVVEGIQDTGSVDWVTEAGAGGRVVSLMEAAMEAQEVETALASLSDDELLAHLRAERPQLAEALAKPASESEEDHMGEISPEVLTEALESPEAKTLIESVLTESLPEILKETLKETLQESLAEALPPLVEEAITGERDLIRAEARADADRQIALRDMRDEAHSLIDAASKRGSRLAWPETLVTEAKSKFALTESGPTPGLDVIDEIGEDGEVVKSAREVLREAVQGEIKRQTDILAEIRPTRVRGQGASTSSDADADKDAKPSEGTLYGAVLQEAGIDPDTAYAS